MYFPHSPDLEEHTNIQPLLKERSSPLSLLAHELDAGLFLNSGSNNSFISNSSLGKVKTPRRSLLSQLTATAINSGIPDNISSLGSSVICDLTANLQSRSVTKNFNKSALFSSPLALENSNNLASLSEEIASFEAGDEDSEMCVESDMSMKLGDFTSVSAFLNTSSCNQNPFSQKTVVPPPSGLQFAGHKRTNLKFKDQNGLKPPRALNLKFDARLPPKSNITSHWNQRKPVNSNTSTAFTRHKTVGMVVTKKRENDNNSPKGIPAFVMNGSSLASCKDAANGANPRKIRRAMSFNGAPNAMEDPFPAPEAILPSFLENGKDMLRRISSLTLVQLLNGAYKDKVDEFHLIDCRYPFEYHGGHIKSAANINQVAEIQTKFFASPVAEGKRVVIVFHCEYSVQRAPQMALYFRGVDRNVNKERYPYLHYPDIYILQGGYRDFFIKQQIYCDPPEYIEMNDSRFESERNSCIVSQKKDFPKASSGGFFN